MSNTGRYGNYRIHEKIYEILNFIAEISLIFDKLVMIPVIHIFLTDPDMRIRSSNLPGMEPDPWAD
jgi:hypothetical protein